MKVRKGRSTLNPASLSSTIADCLLRSAKVMYIVCLLCVRGSMNDSERIAKRRDDSRMPKPELSAICNDRSDQMKSTSVVSLE